MIRPTPSCLLLAGLLVLGACAGDDSQPVTSAEESMASSEDSVPAPLAFTADQQDAVQRIKSAVDELLNARGLAIEYTSDGGDGGSFVGTVIVDNQTGDFSLTETVSPEINPDLTVVSEKVLLGDALFVRIYDGKSDGDTPWAQTEPGTLREKFVGEVYTGSGLGGASLPRLALMLESVPWRLLGDPDDRDTGTDVFGVEFEAEDIWEFFGREELELVGPSRPHGSTSYEFVIDASTSALEALRASGTQFQDGEPLEGVDLNVTYSMLDDVTITEPGTGSSG